MSNGRDKHGDEPQDQDSEPTTTAPDEAAPDKPALDDTDEAGGADQ